MCLYAYRNKRKVSSMEILNIAMIKISHYLFHDFMI